MKSDNQSSNNGEDKLTGHEYDGIQEYDNKLPIWWLATFIGTVIFAFIYWIHYEFAGGPDLQAELKVEMEELQQRSGGSAQGQAAVASASEDDFLKMMTNAEIIEKGKLSFAGKCAACHGDNLQGLIGPNLVDEYWIHGKGKLTDIQTVVAQGVPEKGMPAWAAMLKNDEIESIVAYIGSLKGSKPANPKAPQGEKVVNN